MAYETFAILAGNLAFFHPLHTDIDNNYMHHSHIHLDTVPHTSGVLITAQEEMVDKRLGFHRVGWQSLEIYLPTNPSLATWKMETMV